MRKGIWLLILVLYWGISMSSISAEEPTTVEQVKVIVQSAPQTSSRAIKRMTVSVKTIGEQLIVGRKISEVSGRKEFYEQIVKEVFDRVLFGYSVKSVDIETGRTANVRLVIVPWGDTIQDVSVEIGYSGIADEMKPFVRQDLGTIENDIRETLIGLPVEAIDWASAMTREVVREVLNRKLPDFSYNLDFTETGKNVRVKIFAIPTGNIVRETQVVLRSSSVPNMLMATIRPNIQRIGQSLRGLPVSYVERKKELINQHIAATVAKSELVRRLHLNSILEVRPGIDSEIRITLEADQYRLQAEAYLDVGKTQDNISGKVRFGRSIGWQDEVFFEIGLVPGNVNWILTPGWSHKFTSDTYSGIRFRTNDNAWSVWLQQGLGGAWSLRGERWFESGRNEVGLRYKLHEYLSVEFMMSNELSWLRFVGHL